MRLEVGRDRRARQAGLAAPLYLRSGAVETLAWAFILTLSLIRVGEPQAAAADATRSATNTTRQIAPHLSVSEWWAKDRSEHETVWQSIRYATNPATGRVRATTNSYIELGTGLNRRNDAGDWERASAAFQITATGAEASLASHRVTLNGNINSAGAVQIEKDGMKMQGHPLCVAYFDPVDGRSLMLGELTDATGWLVASNEIVFSNCFNGLSASIRYRNSIDGLESDLIFHERPVVTPEDLGFSEKTRLELFTEWIGDTPLPQAQTRLLMREKDTEARKQMVEPDFTDSTLNFGSLRIARGKAFTTGGTNSEPNPASAPDAVTVGKRFEIIDGRKMLIEAVEHRSVASLLEKLPAARFSGVLTNAAATPLSRSPGTLSPPRGEGRGEGLAALLNTIQQTTDESIRWLPTKRLAQVKTEHHIQTAAVRSPSPGGEGGRVSSNSQLSTTDAQLAAAEPPAFILDWQLTLTSGLTDFTLSSITNYLCAGTINFYGTTRIQGGTVVKFAPAPAASLLKFFGPVICETDMHHPAYFVSKFDATVGEVMDGNTTPASYTGALELTTTGNKLKHLRVRNASVAINGWDVDVRHSQFTACNTVFYMPESGMGSGPCRLAGSKEGTEPPPNKVNIGLHYVGANSANLAIDTDTDGLVDFAEDRDGDNVLDTGETSYQDTDTDYDGRSDRQELAEDNTDPRNAASVKSVRLGYWRFNDGPSWLGEGGQQPISILGTLANPSSWSGKALYVNASLANLKYRDVEPGGLANINCRRGTIRLWFKPDWASGVGPGAIGRPARPWHV